MKGGGDIVIVGSAASAVMLAPAPAPAPAPKPSISQLASCVGSCGAIAPSGCWCDTSCVVSGDCCSDRSNVCGGAPAPPPRQQAAAAPPPPPATATAAAAAAVPLSSSSTKGSCQGSGRCGHAGSSSCYCDAPCSTNGDCCADYAQVCLNGQNSNLPPPSFSQFSQSPSCSAKCGSSAGTGSLSANNVCFCDSSCTLNHDCCKDFSTACPQEGGQAQATQSVYYRDSSPGSSQVIAVAPPLASSVYDRSYSPPPQLVRFNNALIAAQYPAAPAPAPKPSIPVPVNPWSSVAFASATTTTTTAAAKG